MALDPIQEQQMGRRRASSALAGKAAQPASAGSARSSMFAAGRFFSSMGLLCPMDLKAARQL